MPLDKHVNKNWLIKEVAPDFELIDAWLLPAQGSLEEFDDLCEIVSTMGPGEGDKGSRASEYLFRARNFLGARFGWDEKMNTLPIPGGGEQVSLSERLPAGVEAATPKASASDSFAPVFRTKTESAAELSNGLLHAVMHLAWVEDAPGSYRGQMGVYVKHRRRMGSWYMKAIAPFRHYIVYPAMMSTIGRGWASRPSNN